jgi:hypothetical protein
MRRSAKLRKCSHCKQTGYMVGHGAARGNGHTATDQLIRGQRFACGKRNRQRGCGRTICVWHATTLRRRSVFTSTLSSLLQSGLHATSRHAGWQRLTTLPISLRHCYRLWHTFDRSQSYVRTTLAGCCAPPSPDSSEARPLAQLIAHLQHRCVVATASLDILAMFQLQFQQAILCRSAAH